MSGTLTNPNAYTAPVLTDLPTVPGTDEVLPFGTTQIDIRTAAPPISTIEISPFQATQLGLDSDVAALYVDPQNQVVGEDLLTSAGYSGQSVTPFTLNAIPVDPALPLAPPPSPDDNTITVTPAEPSSVPATVTQNPNGSLQIPVDTSPPEPTPTPPPPDNGGAGVPVTVVNPPPPLAVPSDAGDAIEPIPFPLEGEVNTVAIDFTKLGSDTAHGQPLPTLLHDSVNLTTDTVKLAVNAIVDLFGGETGPVATFLKGQTVDLGIDQLNKSLNDFVSEITGENGTPIPPNIGATDLLPPVNPASPMTPDNTSPLPGLFASLNTMVSNEVANLMPPTTVS